MQLKCVNFLLQNVQSGYASEAVYTLVISPGKQTLHSTLINWTFGRKFEKIQHIINYAILVSKKLNYMYLLTSGSGYEYDLLDFFK